MKNISIRRTLCESNAIDMCALLEKKLKFQADLNQRLIHSYGIVFT